MKTSCGQIGIDRLNSGSPIARMKKAAFALVIMLILGIAVGMWWTHAPKPPVYQGKPLSWWLRSAYVRNATYEDAIDAMIAGGPDSVRWLTWAVEHGHRPDLRRASGPNSRWESILQFFHSPDFYDERTAAAVALPTLSPENEIAIPALARVLEDRDESLSAAAAETLNQMQPRAWSALIQAAGNESPRVRRLAVQALQLKNYDKRPPNTEEDIQRVVGALAKAFADPDPLVRAEAACSFGNCRGGGPHSPILSTALSNVLKLLSDPVPEVRVQAGWAVYAFGREAAAAVPQLMELLRDSNPKVRAQISRALSRVDTKERRSLSGLLTLAQDPELSCRIAAAVALGKFGVKAEAVITELIQRLNDADPDTRANAMLSLEEIGPTAMEVIPAILTALEKPCGGRGKWDIAYNLPKFGRDAVPYLIKALTHSDPLVRLGAIAAFDCQFNDAGTAEVIAALNKAANDPDERVRSSAKGALQSMKR